MLRNCSRREGFVQMLNRWYRQILNHPTYRWILIVGTLVYFLSPIDLSPDFIPLLGQVDDAVLMTLLVSGLFQMISDRLRPTEPASPSESEPDAAEVAQAIDVDAVSID